MLKQAGGSSTGFLPPTDVRIFEDPWVNFLAHPTLGYLVMLLRHP
jgi:hypothetical protein